MKNLAFHRRFVNAARGIFWAWKAEASFRTQVLLAGGALGLLLVIRPQPIWWALFALAIGGVLTAELFNTALENVIDRLHPEQHPLMGQAKDCAAAAVLIMSLVACIIGACLFIQLLRAPE